MHPLRVQLNSVAASLDSRSSRCNNPLTPGGVLSIQSVLNHPIFPACPVQTHFEYLNATFLLLMTLFDVVVLSFFLPLVLSACGLGYRFGCTGM